MYLIAMTKPLTFCDHCCSCQVSSPSKACPFPQYSSDITVSKLSANLIILFNLVQQICIPLPVKDPESNVTLLTDSSHLLRELNTYVLNQCLPKCVLCAPVTCSGSPGWGINFTVKCICEVLQTNIHLGDLIAVLNSKESEKCCLSLCHLVLL